MSSIRIIDNPAWLDKHGRPQDPVSHYKQIRERQEGYKKKYHPLDRREERLAKEAGEKRIKTEGPKVFIGGAGNTTQSN